MEFELSRREGRKISSVYLNLMVTPPNLARKTHEQLLRNEQRKIIADAESDLARRLAELESEESPKADPAPSLFAIFKIIFEDKLNREEHITRTTFTLNDIEHFDIEENIVRRFMETAQLVKDLSSKYVQLKRNQAKDKITKEIEDFKQDIEKEGRLSTTICSISLYFVLGNALWQSEQRRVQDGWAESGDLRRAFIEEQQKSAKSEEDLVLSYIRDQVTITPSLLIAWYAECSYAEENCFGDSGQGHQVEGEKAGSVESEGKSNIEERAFGARGLEDADH